MTEAVLVALIVVAGTAGELCVARTMKAVGEVADFTPRALLRLAARVGRIGWLWAGITLMAVAFFALLGMLAVENVSFVVPVTALSYVVGALGGMFFLGEQVTFARWVGVLLVCVGVILVCVARG